MEQRVGFDAIPATAVRGRQKHTYGSSVSSHLSKFHLRPGVCHVTHLQKDDKHEISFDDQRCDTSASG